MVGADGGIGSALMQALDSGALGTTRRPAPASDRLRLDLADPPEAWPDLPHVSEAYLCAGQTSLAVCREQPEASALINVTRMGELAHRLVVSGAFPVYLSTSLVFDGSQPAPEEGAAVAPRTEYDRQKAEAERRLLGLGAPVAVIRLSKVIAPHLPLFRQWREELHQGRPIHPFHNLWFAPMPLAFAVNGILALGRAHAEGIFHISGPEEISYADAAAHLAQGLGVPASLVRPISAGDRIPPEERPAHTRLADGRFRALTGLTPPTAGVALEQGWGA